MNASPQTVDLALLRRARVHDKGGRRAYGRLVERHQARLVRLCTFLTKDQATGEDVAQEAFVRAYSNLARCPDDAEFGAWVRVIATRLAFNHRRDTQTRRKYEAASRPLQSFENGRRRIAERDALTRALDQLSYPYREILVLRYLEEMSVQEIASALDLGESATKMRLKRAREALEATYVAAV